MRWTKVKITVFTEQLLLLLIFLRYSNDEILIEDRFTLNSGMGKSFINENLSLHQLNKDFFLNACYYMSLVAIQRKIEVKKADGFIGVKKVVNFKFRLIGDNSDFLRLPKKM